MQELQKIPTGKVERASKFISTGVKIGGNYLKYYSKKLINPELDKTELNEDNASDIYQSLSELKGSALKVAQMMSMDKNLLPKAYSEKFQLSQYSVPPLSFPLVVKTFKDHFGKSPSELFDTFSTKALNAASIGQVHQASLKEEKFAVKIQYPGVGESVKSDLQLVKPIAQRLFNIPAKELEHYLEEVEIRLLEETDYQLELERSLYLSERCKHLPLLQFPQYYPKLSGKRILTMQWIDGQHLRDWLKKLPSQELRNNLGQALWDFYHYQLHELRLMHADPHPGNFIITPENKLGIIDFGCTKAIPEAYYKTYFRLIYKEKITDKKELEGLFYDLQFLSASDTPAEHEFFFEVFKTMVNMLAEPFYQEKFDFGNDEYFTKLFEFGDSLRNNKMLKNSRIARGDRDGIYINRMYFGLYTLLNEMKAEVNTRTFIPVEI